MKLVFLLLLSNIVNLYAENVIVTKNGPIVGEDRGNYTTFFGIPYALVDEKNPFGVSLPHPKFETPFNATDSSVKCPQVTNERKGIGILQCLRLNIFVPKTINKNLPVLLWIHGGGFSAGSGGEYDGKYLVQNDIIVVTINYRLGPYGFLCLDTDDVPGNQGLKDQVTAMRWVKENIAAFGGDPNKITIDGESYGGGSVELHLYSETEKLFDKAIIQSGGIDTESLIVETNTDAAFILAKLFESNVTRENSLSVLVKQNPTEVAKAQHLSGMFLCVCIEKKLGHEKETKNFITQTSFDYYAPHKVSGTPIIIGYNSEESFSEFFNATDEHYAKDIFLDKIKNKFDLNETLLEESVDSVKKFYLGSKNLSKEAKFELMKFSSDFMVNYPEERAVTRFLNQSAVVFQYLFSYTGYSLYKGVEGVGADHTDELDFLFDFYVDDDEFSGDDNNLLMRERMTTMWANFVKYGDPTPQETDLLPVKWQQASQNTRSYLDIDLDIKMKDHLFRDRMNFWDMFWQTNAKYRKLYPLIPNPPLLTKDEKIL